MTNINQLPKNLPIPKDDGQAQHLLGLKLPNLELMSTNGSKVNLSLIQGFLVVYCYPMTGVPNTDLPVGWDDIPGARGCTPQSCAYRDHYGQLQALNAEVFGLSVQSTEYQQEMVGRLHLPFMVLSDADLKLQKALNLPTLQVGTMTLIKRLTIIAKNGVIKAVHYPVFPSDSDPVWVIEYLSKNNS
jgi:peroxiredoxin